MAKSKRQSAETQVSLDLFADTETKPIENGPKFSEVLNSGDEVAEMVAAVNDKDGDNLF